MSARRVWLVRVSSFPFGGCGRLLGTVTAPDYETACAHARQRPDLFPAPHTLEPMPKRGTPAAEESAGEANARITRRRSRAPFYRGQGAR